MTHVFFPPFFHGRHLENIRKTRKKNSSMDDEISSLSGLNFSCGYPLPFLLFLNKNKPCIIRINRSSTIIFIFNFLGFLFITFLVDGVWVEFLVISLDRRVIGEKVIHEIRLVRFIYSFPGRCTECKEKKGELYWKIVSIAYSIFFLVVLIRDKACNDIRLECSIQRV